MARYFISPPCRQVGDRSSRFYPDVHTTRARDGNSYIYEELLQTEGTDVKVYAVGPDYAHAEARKSPVVDGKVLRNARGKESRYPLILHSAEKEVRSAGRLRCISAASRPHLGRISQVARKVVIAFGQTMCGFDFLRSGGTSYVCDVNGWSFVKDSAKFWSDSANLLRQCCLSSIAPDHLDRFPVGEMPPGPSELVSSPSLFSEESQIQPLEPPVGADASELLCVIAISRHGDRTPKQKLKLRTREPSLLSLIIEAAGEPRAEIKIKKIKHMEQARARGMICSSLPQRFAEMAS